MSFTEIIEDPRAPEVLAVSADLGFPIRNLRRLARAGNHSIYRGDLISDGSSIALKRYHSDSDREFQALSFLKEHGVQSVPKALAWSADARLGLYEWISGTTPTQPTASLLQSSADFLMQLFALRKNLVDQSSRFNFPGASAARLCWSDYVTYPQKRLETIFTHLTPEMSEMRNFLKNEFEPRFRDASRGIALSSTQRFTEPQLTLSPSDFGLHNVILTHSGEPTFVDFEYFGTDHLAKAIADYLYNAGHSLTPSERSAFVQRVLGRHPEPETLCAEISSCAELIALEWVLITLNVVIPEIRARRLAADPSTTETELISTRFDQARTRLAELDQNPPKRFLPC